MSGRRKKSDLKISDLNWEGNHSFDSMAHRCSVEEAQGEQIKDMQGKSQSSTRRALHIHHVFHITLPYHNISYQFPVPLLLGAFGQHIPQIYPEPNTVHHTGTLPQDPPYAKNRGTLNGKERDGVRLPSPIGCAPPYIPRATSPSVRAS